MVKKQTTLRKYRNSNMKYDIEGRYRGYVATDFRLDDSPYRQLDSMLSNIIIGEELCPTTQKKHYQIYMYFRNQIKYSSLIKLLTTDKGSISFLEPALGKPQENLKYCSKSDNIIWKKGSFQASTNGHTIVMQQIKEYIEAGNIDYKDKFPRYYAMYQKWMTEIALYSFKRDSSNVEVWYVYGPSGIGKTRYCKEWATSRGYKYHLKPSDSPYFDGYNYEEVLIIDEFDKYIDEMKIAFVLQLLDIYDVKIPVKHGYAPLMSRVIFLIGNKKLTDLVSSSRYNTETRAGILRRFMNRERTELRTKYIPPQSGKSMKQENDDLISLIEKMESQNEIKAKNELKGKMLFNPDVDLQKVKRDRDLEVNFDDDIYDEE